MSVTTDKGLLTTENVAACALAGQSKYIQMLQMLHVKLHGALTDFVK